MLGALGVFVGGGVGSLLRWLICGLIPCHWGTMLVNLLGAFFIGVAYSVFSHNATLSSDLKLFIMTGLLGGFTTFSTYLLDFNKIMDSNHTIEAICYLVGSVALGCLFLMLGIRLYSMIKDIL